MDSSTRRRKRDSCSPNLAFPPKLRPRSCTIVAVKLEKDDTVPVADPTISNTMEATCALEPKKESEPLPLPPPRSRLSEKCASTAEILKKSLFSHLESLDNSDVELMSELANAYFISLGAFHADYSDVYNRAKEMISHKVCVGKAEKEIGEKGCVEDLIARQNDLKARSMKAEKTLEMTKSKALETRKLLEEIEANAKFFEASVVELEKDCDAARVEEKCFGEEVEKMKEVERLRERSVAAIRTIVAKYSA